MTTVATPEGRVAEILTVTPDAQASVNADTVVAGTAMDARPWTSVCYTIQVATNAVDWSVMGANASTYADEVAVLSNATVAASASSSYAVAQAPFAYYRVYIHSNVGGAHGTATVRGICKA